MKIKELYAEKGQEWIEKNLRGITDPDYEIGRGKEINGGREYEIPGGKLIVNNSACDCFIADSGEEYFLD